MPDTRPGLDALREARRIATNSVQKRLLDEAIAALASPATGDSRPPAVGWDASDDHDGDSRPDHEAVFIGENGMCCQYHADRVGDSRPACLNCNDTGYTVIDGARRPCLWDHGDSRQSEGLDVERLGRVFEEMYERGWLHRMDGHGASVYRDVFIEAYERLAAAAPEEEPRG